jgi:S1-C subfamily serine protease
MGSTNDPPVSGGSAQQPPYAPGPRADDQYRHGGTDDPYRRGTADGPYGTGGQAAGGPYGNGPYGERPYGGGPYPGGPYGERPYGEGASGGAPSGGGPYPGGPYGEGASGGAPSGGGPYPGGPYPGGPYPGGPYGGGPQGEGPYGGGPYGGGPYGGGPAGPGGPYGYGYGYGVGGPQGPRTPVRRFRRGVAIAAVALAAGLGAFFALGGAGSTGTGMVLTTSQIQAQVNPGLVDVASALGYEQAESFGTGLVLTSSGEILTNNHVIEGATSVKVTDIGNGHSYRAKVVGYNQTRDIAVLQLQDASGLKTVKLGNSDTAAVGQKVVALGNAGGKGGTPSVATGQVTALNASITASDEGSGTTEQLTGLINHDAPIQPGDSGGPLVNTAGQVIGIDTAASNTMQFHSAQSQQANAFAIPINEALAIGNQIVAGNGSSTVHIGATGFIGVAVQSADNAAQHGVQKGSGAAVQQVLQGTPAAGAGLTGGDVITSVDGHSVSSPSALQAALEEHHPGDKVTIGWTDQAGQAQSASVTLANGPAA